MDMLFEAIQSIEDCGDFDVDAWQYLIDSGHVWKLQGYYGRTAIDLLKQGICKPAPERHTDFWGNIVPSSKDGFFDTSGSWVWTNSPDEEE